MNKMRNVLDVLDLIEAQVQAGQVAEFIQALYVRDKVVVEVKLLYRWGDIRGKIDALYLVLSEA